MFYSVRDMRMMSEHDGSSLLHGLLFERGQTLRRAIAVLIAAVDTENDGVDGSRSFPQGRE